MKRLIETSKYVTENFTNPNGVISEYTPLDTSLEKLGRKYTTTKTEWRKISDRCKTEWFSTRKRTKLV